MSMKKNYKDTLSYLGIETGNPNSEDYWIDLYLNFSCNNFKNFLELLSIEDRIRLFECGGYKKCDYEFFMQDVDCSKRENLPKIAKMDFIKYGIIYYMFTLNTTEYNAISWFEKCSLQ